MNKLDNYACLRCQHQLRRKAEEFTAKYFESNKEFEPVEIHYAHKISRLCLTSWLGAAWNPNLRVYQVYPILLWCGHWSRRRRLIFGFMPSSWHRWWWMLYDITDGGAVLKKLPGARYSQESSASGPGFVAVLKPQLTTVLNWLSHLKIRKKSIDSPLCCKASAQIRSCWDRFWILPSAWWCRQCCFL